MEYKEENKMGTMPVLPLIFSMAAPAILSMMVQALYNIVDSYFVAQISENALTAVSLVFPIQTLLIAFGMGTAVGLNSLISRRLGEKRRKEADSAATHGIVLGVLNWAVFFLVGLLASGPFLRMFTQDGEIVAMGAKYMSIVCMFSFGVFVEINIEKILQATGNMIFPMIFQLIGAVINIILDPVFIFGFQGIPKMGVAGAAVATVIAQILAMTVSLSVIFRKKHEVTITFHNFHLNKETIRNIYSVGFPSILMQSIGSVMVVGMNAILIMFTTTAVAVFGIYFKLQSFVFMPVFGLTQGVMPIMGYNFGAEKPKRMIDTLKIGSMTSVGIMLAGVICFWAFPERLLMIFDASQQMLSIGTPALRIISLCFVPAGLGIMFSTLFQAVGHGVCSLFISLLRQLVVLLPSAWLLSFIGLSSVWYALPIAEVFSMVTSILMYRHLRKKIIQNPIT